MKKPNELFCSLFVLIAIFIGMIAPVTVYTAISGSAYDGVGDLHSLAVFGNNVEFTCLWTDGSKALMESPGGHRRVIALNRWSYGMYPAKDSMYSVKIGRRYHVASGVPNKFFTPPPRLVED